jgi:hypothetical protein
MQSVLQKQNHAFGNFTGFSNIKRFNPGSIYNSPKEYTKYYIPVFNKKTFSAKRLSDDFKNYSDFWNYEKRIIAISGGFDSRYILANGDFKIGYCYGPSDSGDRVVADKFKWAVEEFYGFSLAKMNVPKSHEVELVSSLFEGLSPRPLKGLFFAFKSIKNNFLQSNVDYDGFLGDVLQRGTYLTFGGKAGSVYKLFPELFYKNITKSKVEKIIKSRYIKLSSEEFEMLLEDFYDKTESLNISALDKWMYYEIFYGRGTRYIAHGGIVMKSQFFTVVPMFYFKAIFENLMTLDKTEAIDHNAITKIWSVVDMNFSKPESDSGYSPVMLPVYARVSKLLNRFINKFIIKEKTFDDELI